MTRIGKIIEKLKNEKTNRIFCTLWFPISLFFMEIVGAAHGMGFLNVWGFIYTLLFSVSAGLLFNGICCAFGKKRRFALAIIISAFISLLFDIQTVYYTIFRTYTVVSSMVRAGDVLTDFWKEAVVGIAKSLPALILLSLPLVLLCIFGKRVIPDKREGWKTTVLSLLGAAAIYAVTLVSINFNTTGIMSFRYVYFDTFSVELEAPRFGLVTTFRLDIENVLAPTEEKTDGEQNMRMEPDKEQEQQPEIKEKTEINEEQEPMPVQEEDNGPAPEPEPVVYEPNVMEIDFDALIEAEKNGTIKDMHEYFSSVEPTYKNEYTGMFEGKNLIWIVGEAFSSFALDEEHTPTLTKLSREGFVFNNFYNPIWGVSTSDGEYTTLTGLIPKAGAWSFSRSGKNYMPFGFGNMLGELGYKTLAYHNHTYTYYDRDTSHPNMGYDYKAIGNGLDIKKVWPASDVEMMENTVYEYINEDHFHIYYLTVSGHLNYNFMGNTQAYKHKADVKDMLDAGYSEAASAYIACQMEFDQSVGYLINALEDAGKLEDTVIVISGDHYPYGLETDAIEELYGGKIDTEFELYHSTLIVWNSGMEPVEVNKICCALDVMPTLANLFGLEYDSRLVMGRDILSDADGLVIFNNRSFLTDYGRYDSSTDRFTPKDDLSENIDLPDDYAASILEDVNGRFDYSRKILENDYYAKVLKNELEHQD